MNSAQARPEPGRGAQGNPAGRFEVIQLGPPPADDEAVPSSDDASQRPQPAYWGDATAGIISENDSPDIPFRFSLNPYRGCEHGCTYCYARPTHEYLNWSAGLDFETQIVAKQRAPELLEEWLALQARKRKRSGNTGLAPVDPIALSGVTDAYQPLERELRLTRQCLEIFLRSRYPVTVLTKNALVLRDCDLLAELAAQRLVQVRLSVTTLDPSLARAMEPRASAPAARLRAVRGLRDAGVPVGVMIAPIIPGLTDHEIPSLLAATHEAGAQTADYTILRLPGAVATVFLDWLERTFPAQRKKIEARVRAMRDGKLNASAFGARMHAAGPLAEQIRQLFRVQCAKLGFASQLPPLDGTAFDRTAFDRPAGRPVQRTLFE